MSLLRHAKLSQSTKRDIYALSRKRKSIVHNITFCIKKKTTTSLGIFNRMNVSNVIQGRAAPRESTTASRVVPTTLYGTE